MSLTLALQLRFYELIASKRMTASARATMQQRFVVARNGGVVRLLIAEMEKLDELDADKPEDAWLDIEDEFSEIENIFKDR